MRDWFEQHLRRVLRGRAASLDGRPFSVREVKQRARWLVVTYLGVAVVLVGCLVALVLAD